MRVDGGINPNVYQVSNRFAVQFLTQVHVLIESPIGQKSLQKQCNAYKTQKEVNASTVSLFVFIPVSFCYKSLIKVASGCRRSPGSSKFW